MNMVKKLEAKVAAYEKLIAEIEVECKNTVKANAEIDSDIKRKKAVKSYWEGRSVACAKILFKIEAERKH